MAILRLVRSLQRATLLAALVGCGLRAAPAPAGCPLADVAHPQRLGTDSVPRLFLAVPQAARLGEAVVLAADLAYVIDSLPGRKLHGRRVPAIVIDAAGRATPVEGLPEPFLAPEVVSTPTGLWLFWGDSTFHSTVRASRFDGRDWSAPVVLEPSPRFDWGLSRNRRTVVVDGTLVLVSAADDTAGNSGVVVLRHEGTGWRQRHIRTPIASPAYVTPAWVDGALYLAVVSLDTTSGVPDHNSLFVLPVGSDSAAWKDAQMIQRSGRGAAWDPHWVASTRGALLLWRTQPAGARGVDSLGTAYLKTGGRWRRGASIPAPNNRAFDAIAGDEDGVLILVLQAGDRTVTVEEWRGGRVQRRETLGASSSQPTFVRLRDGNWYVVTGKDDARGIPYVVLTRVAPGCRGSAPP